ncbi:MAG: hypothetical protein IPF66_25255 [Holophagales bacterium]|nr:hypothetical protein [Holophagales bacterium]
MDILPVEEMDGELKRKLLVLRIQATTARAFRGGDGDPEGKSWLEKAEYYTLTATTSKRKAIPNG